MAAALMAAGCVGKVETTGDVATSIVGGGATATCALPSSTPDPNEDCARYCSYLACIGCAPSVAGCKAACAQSYAQGSVKPLCLQCAVDNVGAVPKADFCVDWAPAGDAAGGGFAIVVNLTECGSVCGP